MYIAKMMIAMSALLLIAGVTAAQSKTFSVAQTRAKGYGVTMDTAAIQRSIDAAAKSGGEEVLR